MAESKEIESDLIPKIATGFCSGISRTCGLCGAISGGIMALGLVYGRNEPNESIDPCYLAVQKFMETFKAKFGSTNCQQLIGCDLGSEGGQDTFISNNLVEKCWEYTEGATQMVISIIEDTPQGG